jgi:hypothetical protein
LIYTQSIGLLGRGISQSQEMYIRFCADNLKERDYLEDIGIDEKIILR